MQFCKQKIMGKAIKSLIENLLKGHQTIFLYQQLISIFQTFLKGNIPVGIYLRKVNYRNTRTRCEICSELTVKTPERRQWRRSGVFIVNFENILHFALVFLLLTLNM